MLIVLKRIVFGVIAVMTIIISAGSSSAGRVQQLLNIASNLQFLATKAESGRAVSGVAQSQRPKTLQDLALFGSRFYVGGHVGISRLKDVWTDPDLGYLEAKPNGFSSGFFGGYNYAFASGTIAGIENDFLFGRVQKIVRTLDDKIDFEQQWSGATRVRIGYRFNHWLPYVAGGMAYSQLKVDYSILGYKGSRQEMFVGSTLGVGVDYAMTDRLFLRFDCRYNTFAGKTDKKNITLNHNSSDIRVGLAYSL